MNITQSHTHTHTQSHTHTHTYTHTHTHTHTKSGTNDLQKKMLNSIKLSRFFSGLVQYSHIPRYSKDVEIVRI